MTRFARLAGIVVVFGCAALLAPAFVSAEPTRPLSKPLNLGEFTKSRTAPRPRAVAKPELASIQAQSDQFITTSAVTKKTAAPAAGDASNNQQDSDVARFCSNIADAALDARVAWQKKELEATEARLRERIAELEAKRDEYEKWLKLRDDFLTKAEDNVVEIYSRMNPEAAAQQIASMADDTAAAVLAKLKVRVASAILNEMEPGRGAHLADTLAGMRRTGDGKTRR
jgi:flagellar motility protein MotE (MotC chaperone)